jgi:predicted esterase
MKYRLFAAFLVIAMLLTACVSGSVETQAGPTTGPATSGTTVPTTQTKPTEGEDEIVDLFGALYPVDGVIPRAKDMDEILKKLGDNTPRISEITYTWKNGRVSMEVMAGTYDEYHGYEVPEESPLQLVYNESEFYNYVLYLPEGYDPADTEKKWPVIYFFHGIGEKGEDLNKLLPYGVLRYLGNGGKLDAIVIAPQCPGESHWADDNREEQKLVQFVPEMTEKYNIDTDRMYLTGLSMGGRCSWKLALAMPGTFAAMAVICGRTNTYEFETLNNMPIWMFHGAKDSTVSFDREIVKNILPTLNEKNYEYYKLTVFPTMGHEIWNAVYDRVDVYDWLLSHSLTDNQ